MLTTRTELFSSLGDEGLRQVECFAAIQELIDEADTIAVCAHTSPDGDALGSGLGLAELIRGYWPGKRVTNLLADSDPVPRIYQFLPRADEFVHVADYPETPDLFIAVDLPCASRLNEAQAVCERAGHVAVIDPHPAGEAGADFGEVHLERTSAAAVGCIIAEFALFLGVGISSQMAQDLFCAIVTDTGRFQYQNADAEAFEVASMLVDAGASPSQVSLHVYQSFRLQYLHLESLITGRIVTFDKGRIAYSYATKSDLERTGATVDECDGLIDVVRTVEGSVIALFLKEVGDGLVRGNLRSKGSYDVSGVARQLGGGGHKAAAGFTVRGNVDEVLSQALPLLQELLDHEDSELAEGLSAR